MTDEEKRALSVISVVFVCFIISVSLLLFMFFKPTEPQSEHFVGNADTQHIVYKLKVEWEEIIKRLDRIEKTLHEQR